MGIFGVWSLLGYGLVFLAMSIGSYATMAWCRAYLGGHPDLGTGYGQARGNVVERADRALSSHIGRQMAARNWAAGLRARAQRDLVRAGRAHDDAGDELGHAVVLAVISALVGSLGVLALFRTFSVIVVLILVLGGFFLPIHRLREHADRRIARVTRRLPYAVDMIVLAMEAGATFDEALRILIREAPDEPLHREFDQVLRDWQIGTPRSEALQNMADRVGTEEMASLVLALNIGDEMGTPLVETLRMQADIVRTKRVQRAEKLAKEAGPKMALPNTLIMAANILLILAPFLLKLFSGGGLLGVVR